jgi:hypothetical protein
MNQAEKAEAIRQTHEAWARRRLGGRRRYIWSRGVLQFGGVMWLCACVGSLLAGRFQLVAALGGAIIFAVGGYIWGLFKWNGNEAAYKAGRAELID